MKENSKSDEILKYLKDKYDREFTAYNFIPGNDTFPELYGADKIIAYPSHKPEEVFIAYESSKGKKVFYDNYLLAKWAEELKANFEPAVNSAFGKEASFKVIMNAPYDKYDQSMVNLSSDKYLSINSDVNLTMKIAIKTQEAPDMSKYQEQLFQLYGKLKELKTTEYALSVGFVDSSEDFSEYMRTANVNNTPWINLKKKVYGYIYADETKAVKAPDDLGRLYKQIGE